MGGWKRRRANRAAARGGGRAPETHGGGAHGSGAPGTHGGGADAHGGAIEQHLWLYGGTAEGPDIAEMACHIPGVVVRELSEIMEHKVCNHMLRFNVPVQFVKDELSMGILFKEGGVFTDLDVLGLRVPLPWATGHEGYLFSMEPEHVNRPVRCKGYCCVSLSVVGLPAKSDLAQKCRDEFRELNAAHADKIQRNQRAEIPWHTTHAMWMRNTKLFSGAVVESGKFVRADADPLRFCPMAKTATTLPLKAGGGAPLKLTSGLYHPPSRESITQFSFTVNTWIRQWGEELHLATVHWLQSLQNGGAGGGAPPRQCGGLPKGSGSDGVTALMVPPGAVMAEMAGVLPLPGASAGSAPFDDEPGSKSMASVAQPLYELLLNLRSQGNEAACRELSLSLQGLAAMAYEQPT